MTPDWQPVAALETLTDSVPHEVLVGRALVLLIKRGDRVDALQGLCPHNLAPLATGRLNGDGLLVCPAHDARFDLDTGRCVANWRLPPLARYAVRIEAGSIFLPDPLVAIEKCQAERAISGRTQASTDQAADVAVGARGPRAPADDKGL